MLYAKVDPQTQEILEYPIHEPMLRTRLLAQNISVPPKLGTVDLTPWGYYPVPPLGEYPTAPAGYRTVLGTPKWNGNQLERTWVIVPIDPDFETRLWKVIRARRNQLLKESDWTELPSVVDIRSAEWNQAWQTYRQQLRDITKIQYPTLVVFPRKPNETE